MPKLMISIIIPSRNEALDISNTLDACLALRYEPKEIIVVDDSTDETPSIVAQYESRGVRLIHRDTNSNGCCGARNCGMQAASGDILVLMNSDDLPDEDFLAKLASHFEKGADYVIAQSVVANCDNIWARYLRAGEMDGMDKHHTHEWSEGFACRRAAAKQIGYIPGDFPVPFCRDWMLGVALRRAGFSKVVDPSLVMRHVAPHTFRSYWRNQVWRASMWAPSNYYFRRQSITYTLLRELTKVFLRIGRAALLYHNLAQAFRYSRLLSNTHRELFSMLLVRHVQDAALTVGALKGVVAIVRAKRFEIGWKRVETKVG